MVLAALCTFICRLESVRSSDAAIVSRASFSSSSSIRFHVESSRRSMRAPGNPPTHTDAHTHTDTHTHTHTHTHPHTHTHVTHTHTSHTHTSLGSRSRCKLSVYRLMFSWALPETLQTSKVKDVEASSSHPVRICWEQLLNLDSGKVRRMLELASLRDP